MMDQSSENYYIYRKPVVNIKKLFCRRHPKHSEALSNCRDYLVKTPVVDIAVYTLLTKSIIYIILFAVNVYQFTTTIWLLEQTL